MTHGIVIPCYNESSRLDIDSFLDYAAGNKGTHICFVNDGSSDATRATLAKIKNLEFDNVHIFNLQENSGKAQAVKQGALYLYNETKVDTIGFIDADLSTDFNDYHDLIKALHEDKTLRVIYGSRAKSEDNNIERNAVRGLISSVIRFIIFSITRLNIQDTQCGAKVFHRDFVPNIFQQDFKTRWLFDVEILLRLKAWLGIEQFKSVFLEKPLSNWVHMDGSKLGLKDAVSIPLSLLRIWGIYDLKPSIRRAFAPLKSKVLRPLGHFLSKIMMNRAIQVLGVLIGLLHFIPWLAKDMPVGLANTLEFIKTFTLPLYVTIILFELTKDKFINSTRIRRLKGRLKMAYRNIGNKY